MKKRHVFYIIFGISALLAGGLTLAMFLLNVFHHYTDALDIGNLVAFFFYFLVFFLLGFSVTMSSKFSSGVFQELLFIFSSLLLMSAVFSYLAFVFIDAGFEFALLDWLGSLGRMPISWPYWLVMFGVTVLITVLYAVFINSYGCTFLIIFTEIVGDFSIRDDFTVCVS